MLDWVHRTTLRAVDRGAGDDSPALRTLVASGLVQQSAGGGYTVTPAGRVALEDERSSRWERIAWPVAAVGAAVLIVDAVVGWLT